MIWSEEETLPREEIRKIQEEKLLRQVSYAYNNVDYYKKKMDEKGTSPGDIKSLDDISLLPFVIKKDFRDTYPFGLFAVDRKDLVRIHASSGTTGKPTVVGYTENDMDVWTDTTIRVAVAGGARPGHISQICFGYGMFTGALGLHYGLEKLGCEVIPSSVGNTSRQIMFMKDLETNILVATPSYAIYLAETIIDMGLDPKKDFNLKAGLLGGEGLSDKVRLELNEMWGNDVLFTQNYGMSELNGPGIAGECQHQNGMHINEDHFYAEIIDPETEEVLDYGQEGELVISCLSKQAIPLLRYRTGDITRLLVEKCQCGRTTTRIEGLKGRSDDMLLIRGVNVFPGQFVDILSSMDDLGSNYELIVTREDRLDKLELKVELANFKLLDSFSHLSKLERELKQKIKEVVGLSVKVTFVAPRSLKRFEGKARRVTDLREARD